MIIHLNVGPGLGKTKSREDRERRTKGERREEEIQQGKLQRQRK
jgi:hypothetical protein